MFGVRWSAGVNGLPSIRGLCHERELGLQVKGAAVQHQQIPSSTFRVIKLWKLNTGHLNRANKCFHQRGLVHIHEIVFGPVAYLVFNGLGLPKKKRNSDHCVGQLKSFRRKLRNRLNKHLNFLSHRNMLSEINAYNLPFHSN